MLSLESNLLHPKKLHFCESCLLLSYIVRVIILESTARIFFWSTQRARYWVVGLDKVVDGLADFSSDVKFALRKARRERTEISARFDLAQAAWLIEGTPYLFLLMSPFSSWLCR